MRYALLIYETEGDFAKRTDPKQAPAYWSAWMAYSEAINTSISVTGGAPLEPPGTATTVRTHGGKRLIEDGPYGSSKEQLAGFFLIDVDSLDVAMEWAARAPVEGGLVEVRPILVRDMAPAG